MGAREDGDNDSAKFYNLFNPDGRLVQIDNAFRLVKSSEITALGAKGKSAVCVAVEKRGEDKLVDPTTVTHIFRIHDQCALCVVGYPPDVHITVFHARNFAHKFQLKHGISIPCVVLANLIADQWELRTTWVVARPMCVAIIVFGITEGKPQLWRVDPSGFICAFQATTIGKHDAEGDIALEKRWKDTENTEDLMEFVLDSLQGVKGQDLAAKEVELIVYEKDSKFTLIAPDVIETRLRAIAERDR